MKLDELFGYLGRLGRASFRSCRGGSKNVKTKTYDINAAEQNSEETAMMAGDVEVFDEELAFQAFSSHV